MASWNSNFSSSIWQNFCLPFLYYFNILFLIIEISIIPLIENSRIRQHRERYILNRGSKPSGFYSQKLVNSFTKWFCDRSYFYFYFYSIYSVPCSWLQLLDSDWMSTPHWGAIQSFSGPHILINFLLLYFLLLLARLPHIFMNFL